MFKIKSFISNVAYSLSIVIMLFVLVAIFCLYNNDISTLTFISLTVPIALTLALQIINNHEVRKENKEIKSQINNIEILSKENNTLLKPKRTRRTLRNRR